MLKAGELNRQITLQTQTITADNDGFQMETWADVATVWAAVVTTGGREFYSAQKVKAEMTCLFRIRYRQDITTKMRIQYGSRIFDILSVNDVDGARVELQISAKEVG